MIVKFLVLLALLTTPVFGQGVPSQWSYSWQGNNAQALYPGQVSIPQLGTSPCIEVTAGLLGAGSCADGPTTTILLTKFGYKPDGTTDNTLAVDQAIAAAAAAGGNATIVAPIGTGLVGTTNPIISNNTWFACEGAPGTCTFEGTANAMLQWSTTATQTTGGGIFGISFAGDSSASQTLIALPQSFTFSLQNDFVTSTVAELLSAGTSTTQTSGVYIDQLEGSVANVAAPLILLNKGAGLFVTNSSVYSVNAIGEAVSGRDFVNGFQSWDTISVRDSYIYLMNSAITVEALSGSVIGDIAYTNNWLDELNTPVNILADSGGIIGSASFIGNEMAGPGGSCTNFSGAGNIYNVTYTNNDLRECKTQGASFSAAMKTAVISDNRINQTNTSAGVASAVIIVNGTDVTYEDNVVGIDMSSTSGPGVPTYGTEIDACSNCTIVGNHSHGSTAAYLLGTISGKSLISNNPDLPSTTSTLTVTASPFTHTAGARPETDCISGGTVSSITQNSVGLQLTSGCFDLSPNEALTVTYSATPTFITTVH